MSDVHTDTQSKPASPFTVISGGKSHNPGETHDATPRHMTGVAKGSSAFAKGVAFVFDHDERVNDYPGIGMVDSRDLPDAILTIIVAIVAKAHSDKRKR